MITETVQGGQSRVICKDYIFLCLSCSSSNGDPTTQAVVVLAAVVVVAVVTTITIQYREVIYHDMLCSITYKIAVRQLVQRTPS